jgi:Family of unknown function (DUF6101)
MRRDGCPAGSGRALRLDPFALPVSYAATDATADGRVRDIELTRTRVVVRRSLAGMRMALNLPLSSFAGVGLRVDASEDGAHAAVVLAHKDPGLTLPLFVTSAADDAFADWRSWSAVLGLPLLVDDGAGWREPIPRLGGVRVERVRPRRRRRSVLKRHRPTMPLRRACGARNAAKPVHRGEREIIARN